MTGLKRLLLAVAIACGWSAGVWAQPTASFDPAAFGRWADESFGGAYQRDQAFSGMALVVVSDGKVVLTRTYGQAERAPDRAIDPLRTRFLIGSLSKTFTGLAIAKLEEEGRIKSIDDAANTYLKRYRFGGKWGDRVTIRDLLTHSAGVGFTNRHVGTATPLPDRLTPEALARLAPGLVRPPGEVISYSNVSTGLLAILVEDVTGQPIEGYMRSRIWGPIGLTTAHYHRSMTLEPGTVRPEKFKDGRWQAKPFIAFSPFYYPVGAVSLTLAEAARYAQFHLDGALGRPNPLLAPATLTRVQSPLRSTAKGVGGFGYQMMNFPWGPHRVIGHGGTWPGFESMLMVLPDRNIGIFYSISGPGKIGNLTANDMILSQIYGPSAAPANPRRLSPDALADYVGTYQPTMRPQQGAERLFNFLSPQTFRVVAADGGLMIGDQGPFLNVGTDLFWRQSPGMGRNNPFAAALFGFRRGADGRVTHIVHQQGLAAVERISPWADPARTAAVWNLLGFTALIGLGAIAWRRQRRIDGIGTLAAVTIGPLALAMLPAIAIFAGPRGFEAYLIEGQPGGFRAAVIIGHMAFLAALTLILVAVKPTPTELAPRRWQRAHQRLMGLIGVAIAVTLLAMGVLGEFNI